MVLFSPSEVFQVFLAFLHEIMVVLSDIFLDLIVNSLGCQEQLVWKRL